MTVRGLDRTRGHLPQACTDPANASSARTRQLDIVSSILNGSAGICALKHACHIRTIQSQEDCLRTYVDIVQVVATDLLLHRLKQCCAI